MWCSWRTVSAPSGASRYQPLIGAEQATSLAGGLDSLGGDGGHICPKRPVSTTRVYQMTDNGWKVIQINDFTDHDEDFDYDDYDEYDYFDDCDEF